MMVLSARLSTSRRSAVGVRQACGACGRVVGLSDDGRTMAPHPGPCGCACENQSEKFDTQHTGKDCEQCRRMGVEPMIKVGT